MPDGGNGIAGADGCTAPMDASGNTAVSSSKYEIVLTWSTEDQAFIAEVPELPGCIADGETGREALRNAESVIREWIETARELGRNVPEPKGRR